MRGKAPSSPNAQLLIAALLLVNGAIVGAAAPTVTSVIPNRGSKDGGTSVTITGTGFTDATAVYFDDTAAASYSVVNDTTITAQTPAHDAGLAAVKVTTAGGTGSLANAFLFVAPPIAADDSYSAAFNTTLSVSAPGALGNDNTNGGGNITAVLETNAGNGFVSLFRDGSFTYIPNAGFAGNDRFTYRASNDVGLSNVATVTIAVGQPAVVQRPANLYAWSIAGNVVTLRWKAPTIGPPPTGYVIECGASPGQVLVAFPVSGAAVFTFTAPNGIFYCRVHALNGAERSAASNEITVFVNNQSAWPSAPDDLAAVVNGSTLALSWRNTFAGGTPVSLVLDVTGSQVASMPLGLNDSFMFSGVPAGTYTLTLRALNAAGSSLASNAVTVSFPGGCSGAPATPPNFLAYKIANTIYVVWDPAPAGSPAATNSVLNVSGSFAGSFSTMGHSMNGTVPAGTYNFSVVAMNSCGSSPATDVQTVVIP
ncbi:MAG TPA: IPT/TIG domain-containing protein [Vicinamibacterales bacterium]|nr:IPT/TIG domain-containing protein [Vicinamibacterales bacterium]